MGLAAQHKVLVCDDQADVVEALRLLLKGAGYRIDTADSPSALMARVDTDPAAYDLVLMDMNYTRDTTSGDEGLELVASVRARTNGTPIVVMTAWGSIDLAVDAMQRGAVDFVQKPWDNAKLLATVEKQIRKAPKAGTRHSELEIARTVQQGLFPSTGGGEPGVVEFEGLCIPAREIGGDYYDFLSLPGGRRGFVLADVSGKGVPAALLMANLQALFRSSQETEEDPPRMLRRINSLFCRSTPPAHYATAFFASYDPASRKLDYVNCGHPSALLLRAGSGRIERLETTAMVLGLLDPLDGESASLTLDSGDTLLMFTDGITEAGIDGGEEFGETRVEQTFSRMGGLPVRDLVHGVARAAEEFSRGEHGDDMTLLGFRTL